MRSEGLLADFNAFPDAGNSGVRVGAQDIDGDGFDDILAGTGKTKSPQLSIFDGATQAEVRTVLGLDDIDKGFKKGIFVG